VAASLRGAQAQLVSSVGAATARHCPGVTNFIPQILVNSLAHARLIALDSDALFPSTAALLAEDVAARRLIKLDCRVPEMRTTHAVLYLRGRTLAPGAKTFIETLRAVEAEAKRSDVDPAPSRRVSGRHRHAGGTGG
jgi:hypothetical protein